MSFGLWDDDWQRYPNLIFNLELMKISTWGKRHNNIVTLMPEFDMDRYSDIYIRKDFDDGVFNPQFFQEGNHYGGLAFTNNVYMPLPDEIENCPPDVTLYNKLKSKRYNKSHLNYYTNGLHLRLSLDGKTVNPNFRQQISKTVVPRVIFLHDYDLGQIDNAVEVISDLKDSYKDRQQQIFISTKFPVQVSNYDDLIKWLSELRLGSEFFIQYNGMLTDEQLYNLSQQYKSLAHRLYYNVSYGMTVSEFNAKLPHIYRQILYLKNNEIRFSVSYGNESLLIKQRRLLELFNYYLKQSTSVYINPKSNYSFTLYRYVASVNFFSASVDNWFTREEMRDIFRYVYQNSYETFRMFYENGRTSFKNGEIVI